MLPESKLRLALIFLVLTVSTGTIGYALIEHWPIFDSLYMTIITLATVGYAEIRPMSEAGRAFTMFLIIFGAFNIGFIAAALAQLVLEGQLMAILGKRKMEKKVQRLKNHIILCGFGRVGRQVAQEFSRLKVPFVILEQDNNAIPDPRSTDLTFIQGNAADDEECSNRPVSSGRGRWFRRFPTTPTTSTCR